MTSFAASLPKAELHVHLEGTLEPELMFALAARNEVALPWASTDDLREAYAFDGLEHFLALYFEGCRVLRQRQDFYDLTLAYLRKAAGQNVRRAEMFFGPQSFLDRTSVGDQLEGILDAIDDARAETGIDGALILSAHRHRTPQEALDLLDVVRPWTDRLVGVGLGGAEIGHPPGPFAPYFTVARERGLRTTAHAGEEGPASYVREAVEVCGVERVDHGVTGLRDDAVLALLAAERVPVTLCPLSNLRLKVVDDVAHLPVRRALDAGVVLTVNSDDPPYFGGYVNENYAALNLDDATAELLAANSLAAAWDA